MSQVSFSDILLSLRNEPLADERVRPRADLRWRVKADLVPVGPDARKHRLSGKAANLDP